MKRRSVLPILAASALILALWPSTPAISKSGSRIAALFAPTGDERVIHKAIIGEVAKARKTVDVAIFTFTSRDLAAALVDARKRGCRVRVLMDEESAKGIKISKDKELKEGGVEVKFVRLPGSGARAAKFHHKFCVLDEAEVLTGSFNWTVGADEVNYENLVVIRDKDLAEDFSGEFEKLWKNEEIVVD